MLAVDIAVGIVVGGLALIYHQCWLPVARRVLGWALAAALVGALGGLLWGGWLLMNRYHVIGPLLGVAVVAHALWTARRPTA